MVVLTKEELQWQELTQIQNLGFVVLVIFATVSVWMLYGPQNAAWFSKLFLCPWENFPSLSFFPHHRSKALEAKGLFLKQVTVCFLTKLPEESWSAKPWWRRSVGVQHYVWSSLVLDICIHPSGVCPFSVLPRSWQNKAVQSSLALL